MKSLLTLFFGLVLTISFTACEKEVIVGPAGESALDAKTFNYSLTFTSSDTWKGYTGITGFDTDDVIISYVKFETLNNVAFWTQMPFTHASVTYFPEFSETTGKIYINTVKSNGAAGSPWTATTTLAFKSVLIKSSQRVKHPDLDYSDYLQVKETLGLED